MSMDTRLLARARDRLAAIKRENEQTLSRRTAQVYARLPQVRETDEALRALMARTIGEALRAGADAGAAVAAIRDESLELQARRAELLVEAGYPMDYLDEHYACEKCRDTGYVRGRMCACLKALYREEQVRDLSSLLKLGEETFETFSLDYYDAAPDPETGESPRECMEMIYASCRTYAEKFGKDSPNLLFQGGTGLGKTFLSACIARVVAAKGFSVVYETAVAALDAFEKEKFARYQEAAEDAASKVHQMLSCDLLILDDLGTELVTAFSVSALYTLINTRLTAGKKTIISTNLTRDALYERYSPQILSRLEGEYLDFHFVGRDIRLLRREN